MRKILIKNNSVACAIHVGVTLVLFIPFVLMYEMGGPSYGDLPHALFYIFRTLIFTASVSAIYFLAGRLLLENTKKILTNLLSVSMLFAVLALVGIFAYNYLGLLFNLPYFALIWVVETLFYFFNAGEYLDELFNLGYIYIILALLPSLAMWLGLLTRKTQISKTKDAVT